MRLTKVLKAAAIALATVGMMLPHASLANAAGTSAAKPNFKIADIALGEGGSLQGQVVNSQGVGIEGRSIEVQQNGKVVAKAQTAKNGEFVATGLRGGNYVVVTEGAAGPIRAWSPLTAPPVAAKGIMLIPSSETVRGQAGLSLLTNPGVWIVGAFVGTVVAVAVDAS